MLEQERLKLELIKSKSYLDISDVSLLSGYSIQTIRRRCEDGVLKFIQQVPKGKMLFKKEHIDSWLEQGLV